jgi:arginine/ornithine N-succinyltransferase beta subunit
MILKEVRENRKLVWSRFASSHYDFGTAREKLANNARCFVLVEEGRVIGFAAIRSSFGHPGVWCSHKIVAVPPSRFADVCETVAKFVLASGLKYHCMTPVELAKYREGDSRWRKISQNEALSSWEYLCNSQG